MRRSPALSRALYRPRDPAGETARWLARDVWCGPRGRWYGLPGLGALPLGWGRVTALDSVAGFELAAA